MNNRRENSRQKRKLEQVRRPTDTGKEAGAPKRPVSRARKQGPLKAVTLLTVIAILLTALIQLVPRNNPERSFSAVSSAPASPGRAGGSSAGAVSAPRMPAVSPSGATGTAASPGPVPGPAAAPAAAPPSGPAAGTASGGQVAAAARTAPRREVRPAPVSGSAKIVLVIDDVGYNLRQLEPFLRFPGPITFAVLPGLQYSGAAAKRIRDAGKGLILHQPMEAESDGNADPGMIFTNMSDAEILRVLDENLAQVPGVQGLNNHKGSLATADERVMRLVLGRLRERNLFFLDSRTTAETRSGSAAKAVDFTRILERTVFLDNEADRAAIREAFEGGLEQARTRWAYRDDRSRLDAGAGRFPPRDLSHPHRGRVRVHRHHRSSPGTLR